MRVARDLTRQGLLSHPSPLTATVEVRDVARALLEPALMRAFPEAKLTYTVMRWDDRFYLDD